MEIRGLINNLKKYRDNSECFEVIATTHEESAETSVSSWPLRMLSRLTLIWGGESISTSPSEVECTESAIPKSSSSAQSQSQLQDLAGNTNTSVSPSMEPEPKG